MTRRVLVLIVAIACAAFASVAGAATGNKTDTAAKNKPSATAASAATAAASTRTLDAIRIEGEIDVPQVLFITARDYRRFRDGVPAKYQVTSADIAKSIPLPSRLRLVAPAE